MPENNWNDFMLDRSQMTTVVNSIPGSSDANAGSSTLNTTQGTNTVTPSAPSFQVPSNPLLPPGYQETLDYTSLQYANGFYRTQIGRYVRVDQMLGANSLTTQEGFLIGVGFNYILLQEGYTRNILVVDIYSIKNMYVYYQDRVPAYFAALGEPTGDTDI